MKPDLNAAICNETKRIDRLLRIRSELAGEYTVKRLQYLRERKSENPDVEVWHALALEMEALALKRRELEDYVTELMKQSKKAGGLREAVEYTVIAEYAKDILEKLRKDRGRTLPARVTEQIIREGYNLAKDNNLKRKTKCLKHTNYLSQAST